MERLHKLLNLTSEERWLLVQAFLLLGGIKLGLGLLPFPLLRQLLVSIHRIHPRRNPTATPDQIVAAVNRSSHNMPGGAKCLARAMTTQALLLQHEYACELRIGVAKGKAGQFEAHAWVENQGQILVGHLPDLSRYTPMSPFAGGTL